MKKNETSEALIDAAIEAGKMAKLSLSVSAEKLMADEGPGMIAGCICLASLGVFGDAIDAALKQGNPVARHRLAELLISSFDAIIASRIEEMRKVVANGG